MFDHLIKNYVSKKSINDHEVIRNSVVDKEKNFIRNIFSNTGNSLRKIRRKQNSSDLDNRNYEMMMLPRVFDADNETEWPPIVLASQEKFADELDNVIDKFVRVINVNDYSPSKRFNKKRNDREEIRRRLAMDDEDDYYTKAIQSDKPGRKPSLHSRLQGGMNLQICFMNETASDTESPSSDSESCPKLSKSLTFSNTATQSATSGTHHNYLRYNSTNSHPYNSRPLSVNIKQSRAQDRARPTSLHLGPAPPQSLGYDTKEVDFFTKQARLQIEARMALAQAKDMAHMQMEMDRQRQKLSPITEIIRNSLGKIGITFPPETRRVSRLMLTDMNIAQLQIIVNELHTQIERLNENLVQYLMERDELHMSQDSMLVDIEDLTRYLGAKEQTNEYQPIDKPANLMPSIDNKTKEQSKINNNIITSITSTSPSTTAGLNSRSTTRPQSVKLLRLSSLVKK